ncbi:GIY-YIG nuclease family protein [Sphingomonas sp. 3-13AW]|uniref:GIY-YIG nuclease family protein n=1 Tax=Sphingomonas sp. 3-13AW TaxID=3050450 RepID=UPI003BB4FDC0
MPDTPDTRPTGATGRSIGRASDLAKCSREHRTGAAAGFTRRFRCKRLVWYEACDDIEAARHRERQMKEWQRDWKLREIEGFSPDGKTFSSILPAPDLSQLGPGLRRGASGARD